MAYGSGKYTYELVDGWAKYPEGWKVLDVGGITVDNGGALLTAGSDSLAVISGDFGQQNIRRAAQRLSALFD